MKVTLRGIEQNQELCDVFCLFVFASRPDSVAAASVRHPHRDLVNGSPVEHNGNVRFEGDAV